jgi:uncharacterized protein with HEPN domain
MRSREGAGLREAEAGAMIGMRDIVVDDNADVDLALVRKTSRDDLQGLSSG